MHRALEALGWGFLMLERGVVEVKVNYVYMCLSCHFTCALILHAIGAVGWISIFDCGISC